MTDTTTMRNIHQAAQREKKLTEEEQEFLRECQAYLKDLQTPLMDPVIPVRPAKTFRATHTLVFDEKTKRTTPSRSRSTRGIDMITHINPGGDTTINPVFVPDTHRSKPGAAMTPEPQHKTMRERLKEKLGELSVKSSGFGISHSMTIGHIIDDIEQITGIVDDSWMGVPWTEFLTCEQEAEVMEGRRAIEELKELRPRPHTPTPKFVKNCMCNKYSNCIDCQKHDTAIRNATLDELQKLIEFAEEDEHDDDYWRGISRVSEIIKSLREQP